MDGRIPILRACARRGHPGDRSRRQATECGRKRRRAGRRSQGSVRHTRKWKRDLVAHTSTCRSASPASKTCDTMRRFLIIGEVGMSIYRSFRRSPLSDVHHVAEHVAKPPEIGQAPAPEPPQQDWTTLRKASPADTLFPATTRWIDTLPTDVRPTALGA